MYVCMYDIYLGPKTARNNHNYSCFPVVVTCIAVQLFDPQKGGFNYQTYGYLSVR
jgi:hypothetical protein